MGCSFILIFTRYYKETGMIKRKFLISLAVFLLLPGAQVVFSQKSEIYTWSGSNFIKGMELYEKEKYGAAKNFFEKSLEGMEYGKSELKTEAQYYQALCSIELQNLDAEYLVYQFAMENPESPLINRAYFSLANYMYIKKDWPKTITYFNKVDRFFLDREELSEYYFQKGFAYYMRNDYENAGCHFMRSRILTPNIPLLHFIIILISRMFREIMKPPLRVSLLLSVTRHLPR